MSVSNKTLLWYGHRLTAMRPAEWLHRAREIAKRRRGKVLGGWARYACAATLPRLPIDETRFALLAKQIEPDGEEFWHAAQSGQWSFLGRDWPRAAAMEPGDIWHLDPETGHSWPRDYCFDIPFRHARGDIKYVWELNRLQFLPPLAALAHQRGDVTIRDWCLASMESWIDANPPFLGVNWLSGIELACRATSLVLTLSLLGPETVPAALSDKLRTAFNAHAVWLSRYPSLYSSANNHLIAEAAALYILGATMPDLPGAARYRDYGFRTLVREADKQILADGVGAEQSPTYTAFTLEWYLLALAVASSRNEAFPAIVTERLHRAVVHLRWLTDSEGAQPRIGDDDEGRVIRSGPAAEKRYVSAIMSNLSALTKDEAVAPPVARPELRDLFLGAAPPRRQTLEGTRHFDAGGYTVFRRTINGRETMLVFDHGPLGYLSIAAHGHADALAVWLHIDGQPVLIDAGTYLYHSGDAARNYFRGSRAHNTLSLDDQDQSRISGPFNWSSKAKAWRLTEDGLGTVARHDGYKKHFGLIHQRCVAFDIADGTAITDALIGTPAKADAVARLRYFLSPDLEVAQSADHRVELALDGAPLASIEFSLGEAPLALSIADMDISPRFGTRTTAKCVVVQCPVNLLAARPIRTHIRISAKPSAQSVGAERQPARVLIHNSPSR